MTVDQTQHALDPQLHQRLLHLATHLDHVQAGLDELRSQAEASGSQISALTQNLTNPQATLVLQERLAELATQLEANSSQVEQLAQDIRNVPHRDQVDALTHAIQQTATRDQIDTLTRLVSQAASQEEITQLCDAVARLASREQLDELSQKLISANELSELAGELKRLSRTQFKTNALSESKEQQTASAIATLQEIVTRREMVEEERTVRKQKQLDALRTEARGDLAADLLPALDGLDMALENGQSLLARYEYVPDPVPVPRSAVTAPESTGMWQRLRRTLSGIESVAPAALPAPVPKPDPRISELRDAVTSWLDGLDLVRDRFLALLAKEGIQPIAAQGQPFDPRLHVAVETATVADVATNTVIRVLRKGYRQHNRVLRYAEVVVARSD